MSPDLLVDLVNKTISQGANDPEQAHGEEDDLLRQLVEAFCPDWVKLEVRRLLEADFPRWYA